MAYRSRHLLRRFRLYVMRDRDVRLVLREIEAAAHRMKLTRRRLRRWAVGSALGLIAGTCLVLLTGLVLARSAPSWWRTIRRDDPATIALGAGVENAVLKVVSKNRETSGALSEPWSFEVTPTQANAWLNVRLPKWLANQKDDFRWPKDVTDLQVAFARDRITIGARVRSAKHDQVLSATLEPRLDATGRLYAPATWVGLGRLSIPADWVFDPASAEQYIPPAISRLPETGALLRAFAGESAVVQRASVGLGDGRRVRILSITPRDGALRITCQTEMQ